MGSEKRPRGGDWEHQQERERLLPLSYNTPCPRCGEPMLKGQDLELGHTVDLADDPTPRPGDRIEHALCNREAGREAQHRRRKFNPSRDWFNKSSRDQ